MKRLCSVLFVLLLLSSCAPHSFSLKEIKDLEPYSDKIDNLYRFYPDFVDSFIPSDDYGKVYPYIGTTADIPHYGNVPIYGLCTADGGIVCDPVYRYGETITVGEYRFYVMADFSRITPSASSPYEHEGRINKILIRDDGRCSRRLEGMPYISVNGNYLQLLIGENEYQYLDTDLNPYTGPLTPQTSATAYPSEFYGICPCCEQTTKLDCITPLFESSESYCYLHEKRLDGHFAFISLNGELLETVPHPGQALHIAYLSPAFVFGSHQDTQSEKYAGVAFLWRRDIKEYVEIPAANSIQWLYDDLFMLSRYDQQTNTVMLFDLSDSTCSAYDQIFHNGADIHFAIDGNIGRTFVGGQELFTVRLHID